MVTFDPNAAVLKPNGGYLAPRTDVAASERCYVALDSGKRISGFLQEFADGTASYWRAPGDQARSARSLDAAFEEVFVIRVTTTIMSCPKCGSTSLEDRKASTGEEIVVCAKCGAEAGKRW